MTQHEHDIHRDHAHEHGPGCGHESVAHEAHTDYVHDGHLHHQHGDHVDEHVVAADEANPSACTPEHDCAEHDAGHVHDAACEHAEVPHGEHTDYLVEGHLHHPHGDHCDHHGALASA